MGLILLEAFGALALLGLIVWWTMFHGRHQGERRNRDNAGDGLNDNDDDPPR